MVTIMAVGVAVSSVLLTNLANQPWGYEAGAQLPAALEFVSLQSMNSARRALLSKVIAELGRISIAIERA